MSVSATHTHYAIRLNDTSPTLIGGIIRQNIATGSQVNGEATSGEVYRRFLALYSQKVAPGFSTYAIATALAAIAPPGLNIGSLASGLDFFAQKNLLGGTRAGATSHRQFTFNAGIIVPRRLSIDHGGDAILDYEAVVIYDGTNDPIVITDSVTLPTPITDNERYAMGAMTIGGTTVAAKTRWSIEFGCNAIGQAADGDIWDTFAHIRTQDSVLTVESVDVELLKAANIPLVGKTATHATTTLYLRKRSATGFVADATAEHISMTADGLIVPDEAFSSDGQAPGRVTFTMPLKYDGTNAPLTIDTTATL